MRRDAWASGVSSDEIVDTNCDFVPTKLGIQLTRLFWNSAQFQGIQLGSEDLELRKDQEASIKFVLCPRTLWSNLLQ